MKSVESEVFRSNVNGHEEASATEIDDILAGEQTLERWRHSHVTYFMMSAQWLLLDTNGDGKDEEIMMTKQVPAKEAEEDAREAQQETEQFIQNLNDEVAELENEIFPIQSKHNELTHQVYRISVYSSFIRLLKTSRNVKLADVKRY